MVQITFNHKNYEVHEGETALDCLIRNQVDYPCSCRSGVCQSCMGQLTEGDLESSWQKGLKDTLAAKHYFLPCLAKPLDDIAFALPNLNEMSSEGFIKEIKYFNENVICLHLSVDHPDQWIPGQYVNLINPKGCRRSYSIANIPKEEGYIELHIKVVPKGSMSNWIKNIAYLEEKVHLQGPIGECFYVNPKQESFSMVLAGTGTGLAPLIAITRDALRQQHKGNITLIHGGVCENDLYLDAELERFSQQHKQLTYESCVLKSDGVHQESSIDKTLLKVLKNNPEAHVYVCGPVETTKKLKTTAFLAGIPSAYIYSDAFIY